MKSKEKTPAFHLLKADDTLTVEQLSTLFKKLTGRTPSQEELESARAEIEKTCDRSN